MGCDVVAFRDSRIFSRDPYRIIGFAFGDISSFHRYGDRLGTDTKPKKANLT